MDDSVGRRVDLLHRLFVAVRDPDRAEPTSDGGWTAADVNPGQHLSVSWVELGQDAARLAGDPDRVLADRHSARIRARAIGRQQPPSACADLRDRVVESVRHPYVAASGGDARWAVSDWDRSDH